MNMKQTLNFKWIALLLVLLSFTTSANAQRRRTQRSRTTTNRTVNRQSNEVANNNNSNSLDWIQGHWFYREDDVDVNIIIKGEKVRMIIDGYEVLNDKYTIVGDQVRYPNPMSNYSYGYFIIDRRNKRLLCAPNDPMYRVGQ